MTLQSYHPRGDLTADQFVLPIPGHASDFPRPDEGPDPEAKHHLSVLVRKVKLPGMLTPTVLDPGNITRPGMAGALIRHAEKQGAAFIAVTTHGRRGLPRLFLGSVLVPNAMANLARIPEGLTDEQVLMCPDIMSTGFGGAENGNIRLGDTVAVFAQGPIGLCAMAGARLRGATSIITVDGNGHRLSMSRRMGADVAINYKEANPVEAIMELTGGRGVDVAIEALGTQPTFESCLRVLKPGGILSSLGVYSDRLSLPLDAFAAGLGGHRIVTTLCPGGKERMRRLMAVVASKRVDFSAMVTHRFSLDQIEEAYDLFANQRDGVLKVAITP